MGRSARVVTLLVVSVVGCRRAEGEGKSDGRAPRLSFPDASPAPNSALARELGCDDAGRGPTLRQQERAGGSRTSSP